VLLRIPSSRPNPWTFPQFVRVQILGFLAAENGGFETYVRKFFHLISQIYTTKTPSEWHWRHFYLPIDILQQQHSSACCLREVLIYTFAAVWCTDTKPHVCKHVYNTFIQNPKPSPDTRIFFINPSESIRLQDFEIRNNTSSVPPLWSIKCCVSALC